MASQVLYHKIIVPGVPSALSPLSIYFVFDTCLYVIFDPFVQLLLWWQVSDAIDTLHENFPNKHIGYLCP